VAEATETDLLTRKIIGFAIEVHRQLGPGLLEAAYGECLCFELDQAKISYQKEVRLPVVCRSIQLDCGYRLDIVVEERVIVELKAVERLMPIHEAQILTYLKLSQIKTGLLMNFNSVTLKEGLRRFVL
jgi:GxxExxY protein